MKVKVETDVMYQSGIKLIALKWFVKQWSYFQFNSKTTVQLHTARHVDLKYGL